MSDKRIKVWVQEFKDRSSLVLQWFDPETGKRKSKSAETSDPEKAEEARADLESDLNHGRFREVGRMSWQRFRELFEEEYAAGRRQNTRLNYARTLDQFEAICNPSSLRDISERTVSRFVAGLRKEPGRKKDSTMGDSSIKVRLQFLHTVLSWGVSQKLLVEVPKFPAVKVARKGPQPIPLESFERLCARAPDDMMRAYLLCGWLAGLRLAEAFELEWEENEEVPYLDFERRRIILPAAFTKAAKEQWVPLDAQLAALLQRLPRQGKKVFHFVNSRGVPLAAGGVSQRVRYLAKKAGVRLTMHTLRKGFGCRHAGKVPAQVLQKLMRHQNIKTTMDFYANIDAAVEEAILGAACNTSCNTPTPTPAADTSSKERKS